MLIPANLLQASFFLCGLGRQRKTGAKNHMEQNVPNGPRSCDEQYMKLNPYKAFGTLLPRALVHLLVTTGGFESRAQPYTQTILNVLGTSQSLHTRKRVQLTVLRYSITFAAVHLLWSCPSCKATGPPLTLPHTHSRERTISNTHVHGPADYLHPKPSSIQQQ